MAKVIIFPLEGNLSVCNPSGSLSLEKTAARAVPKGTKYRIIDSHDLPKSREFRNAWEADFSTFDGVGK